jgi:DNA (cytosine-5)-methyltransferase 1
MKVFNVASLFAGVGGIDLGFDMSAVKGKKYNLIIANEFDQYACATYRHNFKHTLIEDDITKIFPSNLDLPSDDPKYEELRKIMIQRPIDILAGGFPCQAFSIAGDAKGFDDHRGNLFLNIVEYIKTLDKLYGKPRILFLENVKNLKSHDKGRTFRIIKETIEDLGYMIKSDVLNTMDFTDIPQNRERIFIIGFLHREDYDNFTFFKNKGDFKLTKTVDERLAINRAILEPKVDEKYYYTKDKYPKYFQDSRIALDNEITERNQFYQLRRGLYVRKNKSNVCPTLTANMGMGGHNVPLILNTVGIRKLTPTETFKLQGFPIGKGYSLPSTLNNKPIADSRFYKQAGNAVTVPLIKLLATEILKIL